MDIPAIIVAIGFLIFLAHFFGWLFSFVRIPDVLMLMGVGILLGPVTRLIPPDFLGDAGNVLVMLILVLILFEGSIKLKLANLKKSAFGTIALGTLSFFFTMIGIGLLLSQVANFEVIPSFLIGAILGSNSTAIVIPLIEKLKIKEESHATLVLESGFSDVFSIVLTLALIASMEIGSFQISTVVLDISSNLIISSIIGISFAFAWSILLNKIHNIQNSVFATPAFVFVVFGVTELFGFSGLVSVIAFGILLGNIPFLVSYLREYNEFFYKMLRPKPLSVRELSFFSEMIFIIKIFFFIFIGISLNFTNTPILMLGLLLSVFILVLRLLAVQISIPKTIPTFDASIMAITVPRGLAPAVLALIPLQRGLEGGELIQDITYAVIFFSIFLTSVFIFLLYNTNTRKIYAYFLPGFSKDPETPDYPSDNENNKEPEDK